MVQVWVVTGARFPWPTAFKLADWNTGTIKHGKARP
jgi:hypothetical protein